MAQQRLSNLPDDQPRLHQPRRGGDAGWLSALPVLRRGSASRPRAGRSGSGAGSTGPGATSMNRSSPALGSWGRGSGTGSGICSTAAGSTGAAFRHGRRFGSGLHDRFHDLLLTRRPLRLGRRGFRCRLRRCGGGGLRCGFGGDLLLARRTLRLGRRGLGDRLRFRQCRGDLGRNGRFADGDRLDRLGRDRSGFRLRLRLRLRLRDYFRLRCRLLGHGFRLRLDLGLRRDVDGRKVQILERVAEIVDVDRDVDRLRRRGAWLLSAVIGAASPSSAG